MKNFVTCHCHPQSLDSGSPPKSFVDREVELGTGAVTVTDHGTLAACKTVYDLGKEKGLIPIMGLEGYFRDDDCPVLKKYGIEKAPLPKSPEKMGYSHYNKYNHITLHFMDEPAYLCGVKLLSKADDRAERHGSERKPLFDWSDLEELGSYNVTATSSCLIGMVQRHIMSAGRHDIAKAYFDRLFGIFGKDNFYAELFPHECTHYFKSGVFVETTDGEVISHHPGKMVKTNAGEVSFSSLAGVWNKSGNEHKQLLAIKNYHKWTDMEPVTIAKAYFFDGFLRNECSPQSPNGDVQKGCNIFVGKMAKEYGTKILIGDDSHFARPEDKVVQDVRLSQGGNWRFHNSYHRQTSQEAFSYFNKILRVPEKTFEKWVDNSHEWADGFKDFQFDNTPSLPLKFYPKNTLKHTKELIKKHGRFLNKPEYIERLKEEIALLHDNGKVDLLPYFFIDETICEKYSDEGRLTGLGRGSAAGLLLSYLLGITHIDPIKHKLSLDRFLTIDRVRSGKLPDIDQDLGNQDLLVGGEFDLIEFEASDGTTHSVPQSTKVETSEGRVDIEYAMANELDFKEWWLADED